MTARRRPLALLLVLVLTFVLAACGDDDDEGTSGSGSGSGSTAAAGDSKEYCEKTLELETLPEPDLDFESLSPEQLKAEAKKFIQADVLPVVDEIEKVVPKEIEADGKILIAKVREAGDTGDFEALENDPQFKAAEKRVHAYDLKTCGWKSSEVEAVDYAFQGIPATVDAGVNSFDFKNTGSEMHELIVFKKKNGVKLSFDEIIELGEEESQKNLEQVGSTFQPPGGADHFVADLKKGSYLAICFLPVGFTPEVAESGKEPQGPPHFTRGMKTEFSVS